MAASLNTSDLPGGGSGRGSSDRRQSDIEGMWQHVPRAGRPFLLILLVPIIFVIVCLGALLLFAFVAPWVAFRRVRATRELKRVDARVVPDKVESTTHLAVRVDDDNDDAGPGAAGANS